MTLSDTSADVYTTGTTAFYRPAGSGAFDVGALSTDGQSGILDYVFPVLAGFTTSSVGSTVTYTLATPTEPNGAKTVTARNQALLTTGSNFTLTSDSAAPTGGALTVNTVAASGGGTQSYDDDGAFTIGVRTDYTDAISGIATSTLTREQGTLAGDACSAYGAPTTLVGTPAQSGLATGCYRYTLTGTDNVGNAVSITTVVKVDTSAPAAPGLVLSDSSADVHTTGTTAFYRPAGTGSFDVTASSTDGAVRDPRLQLPRPRRLHRLRHRRHPHLHPRHADRAQRRQAGHRTQPGPPQLDRHELHAHLRRRRPRPAARSPSTVQLPSGGGTQSYDGDGAFAIGLRTDYTDALSGLAASTLTREQGLLASDACSAYGAPTTLVGTPGPERSGHRLLPLRPHRGRQRRQHRLDHDSRQGRHHRSGGPGLVLSDSSADVHTTGTTAFYRPAGTGSFDVTASSTDAESGLLDYGFPVLAGFTGSGTGATRTYTLATPTEPNGAKPVTARNQALLNSAATNFTLTSDAAAPTAGALTVNTVAASGGGTQSYDDDGAFTIGVRTDYTDAASGLATSTLTREQGTLNADACSAYGAPTTLVGTPAQSGLATGCYRYVLTGTDNVGNTVSITTVVKVDTTAPAAPGLVLSDSSSDVHTTGTTAFYRPAGSGSFDVTASSTDGQSGILDYGFPVLAGFTGSGTGATRTYTLATPTEPNGAKPVTARNQALLSSTATNFTLTSDAVAPTGGALTVNATVATGGGSGSYDDDGAFTIGIRTDYTDAASGLASSTLTREQGTLNADACSAYGAPTTLVGTPAQSGLLTGCYRYILTGTDNVGNTSTVTTVVKVDTSAPAAPGLVLSDSSADVHTTGTTAFYRPAGSGSFDVTASSTDGSPGSSTTASRPSPASPAPAPAPPAPTPSPRRRSPTAPSRSPPATRPCSAPPPPTSPSPPTRRPRPAAPSRSTPSPQAAAAPRATTATAPSRSVSAPTTPMPLSGIATSTLTREQGTFNADACSAYGAPPRSSAPRRRAASPPAATATRSPAPTTSATRRRSPRWSRSTPARRRHRAWCSPTPAPTCTRPAPPPSTAPPAAAPSTSPRPRPTAQSGILDYNFPALAGFTGSGTGATRTYTLATPTEPNGAKPVTARNQALLSSPPPTSPSPPTRPARPAAR